LGNLETEPGSWLQLIKSVFLFVSSCAEVFNRMNQEKARAIEERDKAHADLGMAKPLFITSLSDGAS